MNNGGPAFPQHGWTSDPAILERMQKGGNTMTLRDYFAAQVICGLIHSDAITERDDPQAEGFAPWSTRMSEEAYSIADAMLRAREQVKP